jgi:hypothetical protein
MIGKYKIIPDETLRKRFSRALITKEQLFGVIE